MADEPNLLAQYIERHGTTCAEVARKAGCPAPMVSLWALGKRRPGLENAFKLATATDQEVPATYWTSFRLQKPSKRPRRHPRRVTGEVTPSQPTVKFSANGAKR